jgi:hypothetical protein
MAKYGCSFLQDSWASSELDSSVPGGQEGSLGKFSEGSEDFSKDGVLAPRHAQKRGAKFFRGVTIGGPEDVFQAAEKLSGLFP